MKKLQDLMAKLRRDEKGATVIEYALIAALVAVAVITVFTTLGTNVTSKIGEVNTELAK